MLIRQIKISADIFFRFTRVLFQLVYGAWKLGKLPTPIVSIFGGARLKQQGPYFDLAHDLGQHLVQEGISVLTGGGPGIMQAANCGVAHAKNALGKGMGIGVTDLGEERDPCVYEYIELDYFFARKWLLTHFSQAFVIFPGGYGTLDELAEVLTLIQVKKIKAVPIILVGHEYWDPFMEWIRTKALAYETVNRADLDLFLVVDSIEGVYSAIKESLRKNPSFD